MSFKCYRMEYILCCIKYRALRTTFSEKVKFNCNLGYLFV